MQNFQIRWAIAGEEPTGIDVLAHGLEASVKMTVAATDVVLNNHQSCLAAAGRAHALQLSAKVRQASAAQHAGGGTRQPGG